MTCFVLIYVWLVCVLIVSYVINIFEYNTCIGFSHRNCEPLFLYIFLSFGVVCLMFAELITMYFDIGIYH